ncbi:MAG: hypothetical protein HOO06_07830 [Bdellovibrionaceae bacterium]|jgi:hypothetical protein|nr:hypothetical protein [Pseudobdellovibrionaceae bacterium]
MKTKLLFLTIILSLQIQFCWASDYEHWVFADLPYWNSVLFSEGDKNIQEENVKIKLAKGKVKVSKSSMYGMSIVFTHLEALGATSVPFVYWAPKIIRNKSRSKRAKNSINYGLSKDTSKRLSNELRTTGQGIEFINIYGDIVTSQFNNLGMIISFTTDRSFEFHLNEGIYFEAIKDNDHHYLYIESSLIN